MASTFSLAPSPKWYFFDSFGKPAEGGFIITRSSLDRTTPKFIFSDPAGLFPYDDPMQLDSSGGSKCPMYWEFNGVDLYYLLVTDKFGNKICEVDNYPLIGGGGITPITANIDIENHLVNGQFIFIDANNETDSILTPVPPDSVTHMAPGSGFFKDLTGNYVRTTTSGIEAGWTFQKSGGDTATDTISFVAVTGIGEGFPNSPSANATRYFRYQLSAIGSLITDAAWVDTVPNVETFQNEVLTVSVDTRANIGVAVGELQIVQNFGTGGAPSAPVITTHVLNFTANLWGRQSFQITVPTIATKSKGTNLDDFVAFRFVNPLNTLGSFDQVNHQVQRGTFGVTPYIEQTYAQDQYKVLIDLATTGNAIHPVGELKYVSVNSPHAFIQGWVAINDIGDTLGSATSGAFRDGLIYKNLYVAWWNTFNDSECPVTGGRGGSAEGDFNANKKMLIPRHLLGAIITSQGQSIYGNRGFGDFIDVAFSSGSVSALLYFNLYVKL